MASFTITLTGHGKSELHANFFPPIQLGSSDWEAGLTSFDSYFSIPNLIENGNSTLYLLDAGTPIHDTTGQFIEASKIEKVLQKTMSDVTITITNTHHVILKTSKTLFNTSSVSVLIPLGFSQGRILTSGTTLHKGDEPLKKTWSASQKKFVYGLELPSGVQHYLYTGTMYKIPTGTYELSDLRKVIITELKKMDIDFDMQVNLNTQRCGIKCSKIIDFQHTDSFSTLLGFSPSDKMPSNTWNWSNQIVHVFSVMNIGVSVSCCQGDYRNGEPSHVIYQFTPNVAPGYRMSENPDSVTYHSVLNSDKLEEITVKVIDQDGKLIDFGGEAISIRLHFKQRAAL
uniref:Uncharacterized protein n=1 Tax=Lygus hesperus TaxID=30085 RepID=A0A0K8SLV7_LYGHE